jgi:hypothetical protein
MRLPRLRVVTILTSLILTAAGARYGAHAADTTAGLVGLRPSAADILARITTPDALPESYTVPVHIDVRLHKLLTFHFGMNGMQYFKRPIQLALDVHAVPPNARRLFSQIGSPMTWAETYAMRLTRTMNDGAHTNYRLEGEPKHGGDIDRVILDVAGDPSLPLRAQWFCRDGTTIMTTIQEQAAGAYWLPKRTEVDLAASGYGIHAVLEYGDYTMNAAIPDSIFSGA